MRKLCISAVSALALVLAACSDTPPAVNKTAIEKSIKELEANMVKNIAAKDATSFAANYATDAVMMTPFEPPMKGHDAIKTGMGGMFADPALKLDFSSDRVEVADAGDMAASRGNYTLTVTDSATKKVISDRGSYVTVYRKQTDGAWKAVLDINTSEVPPPAAPAPKATSKAAKKKGKK